MVGYLLYDVIIKNLYIISLILISERHVRQPTDTYYKSYRSTVVCFSKRVDAFRDFQQSFLTEQHHICNFTYFEYIKIHAVQWWIRPPPNFFSPEFQEIIDFTRYFGVKSKKIRAQHTKITALDPLTQCANFSST